MKKEDLRRPSIEGRRDYKIERIVLSLIILFLSFSFSQGQTKLDNFSLFDVIKTSPNFNKFSIVDFNQDGVNDFILYGINKKKVAIHRSLRNGKLSEAKEKFFFYPLTEIVKLKDRKDFGSFNVIISNRNRLAALTSFTKYGTLLMLNKRKFQSAPSGLKVFDVDGDSTNEAYVFGENFLGISRLEESDFVLKESKIINEGVYSFLDFCDLNYDGKIGIVAFELLNNSLNFIEESEAEDWELTRSIKIDSPVDDIQLFDFDKDNFLDILYTSGNEFTIMKGDSVSSFVKVEKHKLLHAKNKIYLYDVDGNNREDAIFVSNEDSVVSCLFNQKEKHIKDIIRKKDIVDVVIKDNQLFMLDKAGFIYANKKGNISGEAAFINSFELPFSGDNLLLSVKSLPFTIDKNDLRLRTNSGFNREFDLSLGDRQDTYALFSNHLIDEYCFYRKNGKALEVFTFSYEKKNVTKQVGITGKPILGVVPVIYKGKRSYAVAELDSANNAVVNIYGLNKKEKKISLVEESVIVKENIGNEKPEITWKDSYGEWYSVSRSDKNAMFLFANKDVKLANYCTGYAQITASNIYFYDMEKIIASLKLPKNLTNRKEYTAKYFEAPDGSQYLLIYYSVNKELFLAKREMGQKHPSIELLIDNVDINNYIVKNYYGNFYLLYTNEDSNNIWIRRIK